MIKTYAELARTFKETKVNPSRGVFSTESLLYYVVDIIHTRVTEEDTYMDQLCGSVQDFEI